MSFASGKASQFKLDNSAGTLVDLSPYCNTGDLDQSLATGDTTTYGAAGASKTYLPLLRDGKASIGGPYDPTVGTTLQGTIAALAGGTLASASVVYGPVNAVTGSPMYTFETILSDFKITSPVGGVIMWTASLQITGQVTLGTYP